MKYQMVYYNKKENITINEIVEKDGEYEYKFEGRDFYNFEDEKGNGMIVKMDSEGDEYTMCLDQCECYVDCEYNDDCGNGMECIEYKCIERDLKKRKNTIGIDNNNNNKNNNNNNNGRRVGQVAVLIPMGVCVFGVFTSMFIAEEYANAYYRKKCKRKCVQDLNSEWLQISVKVNTKKTYKMNKMKMYHCNSRCELNLESFYDYVMSEHFGPVNQAILNQGAELERGVMEYFTFKNAESYNRKCMSKKISRDMMAHSLEEARVRFHYEARIICRFVEHRWFTDIDDRGLKGGSDQYSHLFEFNAHFEGHCFLDVTSAECK